MKSVTFLSGTVACHRYGDLNSVSATFLAHPVDTIIHTSAGDVVATVRDTHKHCA